MNLIEGIYFKYRVITVFQITHEDIQVLVKIYH